MAYLNADQRGGVADNGKPSLTIDEAARQLTRDQVSWGDSWGQAVEVTFAFRSTAPSNMPDDTAGFSRFNTAQINATLLALQSWSDVANITFTRVGSGTSGSSAYSNSATILFGNYSSGADGAAAFAYYPYSTAYSSVDGDVWVNSSLSYNANPQVFNYGQLVLVHEIGHAIGLSHPGDYNAGDGVEITYANSAEYFEDSMQYTVMSYFYESYTGASYGSPYPATIMLDDIAAAQRLYGANINTRTGDTVYGFNSNADRVWFSATSSSTPLIFAVWDAGGTDTFDFSGYSSNARIELREGFFSDVGGLVGNVAVAKGVVIENAIGGNGADRITGNAAANRLQGSAGNDTLTGLGGADIFVFTTGGGADVVTDFTIGTDKLDATAFGAYISIAQSGADAVVNFSSTVSVRLTNVSASNLTDASFVGLANQPPPPPTSGGLTLTGTSGGDSLIGGSGDDTLSGLGGADTLNGRGGADTMSGGAGDDTFIVDNIGDTIIEKAGEGTDLVRSTVSFTLGANVENLTLQGTAAIDGTGNGLDNRLAGNGATNILIGGDGNDRLDGAGGADSLRGGAGNDTYFVDNAGDTIVETSGHDAVNSTVSYALADGLEVLTLQGSASINATGNAGANTLRGNAGANRLQGNGGNDVLVGGGGADIFVVTADGGADTVNDFTVGVDRIDGSAYGVYQSLIQYGADTIITFANGVSLRLKGVVASSLSASSFIGVASAPTAAPLTVDGTAGADSLLGGSGDDTLRGFEGNDTLDGKAGADAMYGGLGNDTFIVDASGDQVIENAGEGLDTVQSAVSLTLSANVENLRLTGTATVATGNSLDNALTGTSLGNTLRGGAGNDHLAGLGGGDVLYGGQGGDTLTGGAGADTFLYQSLGESKAANPDLITDFNPLADVIDLSVIDANAALAGDQAFAWVDAFSGHAGEALLSYDGGADRTTLQLDPNGDGVAELKLEIAGHVTIDGGFIL